MKSLHFLSIFVLLLIIQGCAHVDTADAPVVSLFRAGGDDPDPALLSRINSQYFGDGLVFEIKAGDVVDFRLLAAGDVIESGPHQAIPLTFKKDMYVFVGDEGMQFSLDGVQYKPFDKFLAGSMDIQFSMEKHDRQNRLDLNLSAATRQ